MKRHWQMLQMGLLGVACALGATAYGAATAPARAADEKPVIVGGTLGLTGAFAGPSADSALAGRIAAVKTTGLPGASTRCRK